MDKKYDFVYVMCKDGSPAFGCVCLGCRKPLNTGLDTVWADKKGPSFKAWYCNNCKNLLEERDN